MKKLAILLFSFVLVLVGSVGQVNAETGFSDVNPGDSFEKEMMFLHGKGVIKGYEDGRFGPDDKVTRGAAALMIARAIGLDTAKTKTIFKDVPSDSEASGAIQSANNRGILQGYGDGMFKPNKVVNRGEMAIFIARAFELKDEELIAFSDVPTSKASYSSIRRILAFGVTEGYKGGVFRPDKELTRREFSAFLARAMSEEFRLDVKVCGYDPASKTNPDRQTVNCLLTREALKQGVPPEIVKSVASVENGGWKQFNADGTPFMSTDGGIGVMQITLTDGYDVERLKNDLTYNIEVGVEMLKKNFGRSDLPKVGEGNPEHLESWYFAVMAYNGTVAQNSPFYKATGERNTNAYQEKVYRTILASFDIQTSVYSMNMNSNDFEYSDSNPIIKFKKMHIPVMGTDRTYSRETLEVGVPYRYAGKGLRLEPTSTSTLVAPTSNEFVTILGGPVYDTKNQNNLFVWFPAVIEKNGKKTYGYVASNSINR